MEIFAPFGIDALTRLLRAESLGTFGEGRHFV
jgi:hypothetical protein